MLVTILVALLAGFLITPRGSVYTAKAELYVGSRNIDLNSDRNNVSGDKSIGLSFLANSFAHMIQSRTVAEKALSTTGVSRTLDEVEPNIKATAQIGTSLIQVTVADRDPAVAENLVNSVVDGFVGLIQEQENQQAVTAGTSTATSTQPAPVSVYEHAILPTDPEPNGMFQNLILAFIFGTLVAIGAVLLLEYLDLTLKNVDDTQQRLQLRVLGAIPLEASSARARA